MGYMGWTKAQALEHTPQDIQLAKRGRIDMINAVIKACFGTGEQGQVTLAGKRLGGGGGGEGGGGPGLAPTAANFRAIFDGLGKRT